MHKDADLFMYLLGKADNRFGKVAPHIIVGAVRKLDDLCMRVENATYDVEKAALMHRLIQVYGNTFNLILKKGRKRPDGFDWLSENYGEMIESGTDDLLEGMLFDSRQSDTTSAIILASPQDMEFDSYVRMYEMALNIAKGQGDPAFKTDHNILFGDSGRINNATTHPYRNIYVKIKKP
jgi:hypothetical protein